LEEALEFIQDALVRFASDQDDPWHPYLLVTEGNVYCLLGRFEEAEASFDKAMSELENRDDKRGILAIHGNRTILQLAKKDIRAAIRSALEVNRLSTTSRVYVVVRIAVLLAFGHLAVENGDLEAASILLGGVIGFRESLSLVMDPLDRLSLEGLGYRVSEKTNAKDRIAWMQIGRTINWESWFEALLPITSEDIFTSVPHRGLLIADPEALEAAQQTPV
jgi:tetratricopeptide (TPR) repeat protein